MRWSQDLGCRVCIVPSDASTGCYEWIIRSRDGRCIASSPYAFATEAAARLSGECWRQEIVNGSPMR